MESQFVDFGNYLFEKYGVMNYSTDGKNEPLSPRTVSHADICNWKDEKGESEDLNPTQLPSEYQPTQMLKRKPQFLNDSYIDGKVIKVHFTNGSVSYDLEIRSRNSVGDQYVYRLYNVSAGVM